MDARAKLFEMLGYLDDCYTGTGDPSDEYAKWVDAYAAEVRAETLREAAEFVVTETRAATGADGVSPVWDIANAHAEGISGRLRRMAGVSE